MAGSRSRYIRIMFCFMTIALAVFLIGSCNSGGDDKKETKSASDYNGGYYGTYLGDASGDWCFEMKDGNITGMAWDSRDESFKLTGSITSDGNMVVGTSDDGTQFIGNIDENGDVSGTWSYTDPFGILPNETGTYTGQAGDCPRGDFVQNDELQSVLLSVTSVAVDGGLSADPVATASESLGDVPVDDALQAQSLQDLIDLLTGETMCGTFTRSGNTLVYTISGGGSCAFSSGKITVSDIVVNLEGISAKVVFTDVTTQGCTINGTFTAKAEESAPGQLKVDVGIDNLKTCNGTLDGSVTAVYQATTLTLVSASANIQGTYQVNEDETEIDANLTYSNAGGISGIAGITVDGTQYNCTLQNIVIDETCGIPTSGTLTVSSSSLSTPVTFDFSGTTCINPVVHTLVNGVPVEFSLN